MPHASNLGEAALSATPEPPRNGPPGGNAGEATGEREATPETRFFEALAEIRALKRAANQPGE